MNTLSKTLTLIGALAGATLANAAIVVSRPAVPGAGWTYSDFGPPRQFVATQFRVPGANGYVDVNKITVWAKWTSEPVSFGSQACTLLLLSNVNEQPGNPSFGGGFGQFGTSVGADFLYRYEVNYGSPIRLALGQTYWIHFSGNVGFNFGNLMNWANADSQQTSYTLASTTDHRSGYNTSISANPAFVIEGNVTVTGPSVIAGTLGLEGWDGTMATTAELDIFQNGDLVETLQVAVSPNGTFSTTTARTGVAQIRVRSPRFLHRRTGFVTLGYESASLSVPLVNGDVNGDNEVEIGDYAILSANFGFANAPGDLNGDGAVDIGDFSILSNNFGLVGED
ncbi:MAG TPA: hypothetical protein PLL78_07685 [Fimbriimonadaceae bacterium]|nr:hypothetical protein [Fimbriimonadaceae bacterium]HRJ96554.1 hypothetical protein [Fimbriimonadaceae bacterium]